MGEYNRDADRLEELAEFLNTRASQIENNISELKNLLEAMKSNAVFDDNSIAAIDRILSVVEKLQEPAEQAKAKAAEIAQDADNTKHASSMVQSIGQ